jgi:DNA primase
MANFKSTAITAREAFPWLAPGAPTWNHNVSYFQALWTLTGTEATNDTVELLRLPVGARILEIYAKSAALGTTITHSLGIAIPGGAFGTPVLVGSASSLASGLTSSAITIHTRICGIAAANWGKTLWELGGVSADPYATQPDYSILLTMSSVTSPTAGNVRQFLFAVEMP